MNKTEVLRLEYKVQSSTSVWCWQLVKEWNKTGWITSSAVFVILKNSDKIQSAIMLLEVQLFQSWHLETARNVAYVCS
jgi:hypothetical protein